MKIDVEVVLTKVTKSLPIYNHCVTQMLHNSIDTKMSLNLGFGYFIDSALQTAVKRFSHKKLW